MKKYLKLLKSIKIIINYLKHKLNNSQPLILQLVKSKKQKQESTHHRKIQKFNSKKKKKKINCLINLKKI